MLRYCRGVDRLDAELMFSAYHEDATDDHGVYVRSARGLCDRVVESHRRYDATMHCVLNHAIEVVDERHATGEVYNVTYLRRTAAEGTAVFGHVVGPLPRRVRVPGRPVGDQPSRLRARMDPQRTARRADADRRAALPAGRRGPRLVLLPPRAACYVPFYTSPVVTGDAGPNVGGDCGEGARMRKIEHALSGAVYEWAGRRPRTGAGHRSEGSARPL